MSQRLARLRSQFPNNDWHHRHSVIDSVKETQFRSREEKGEWRGRKGPRENSKSQNPNPKQIPNSKQRQTRKARHKEGNLNRNVHGRLARSIRTARNGEPSAPASRSGRAMSS